jgi:hypothetical protein
MTRNLTTRFDRFVSRFVANEGNEEQRMTNTSPLKHGKGNIFLIVPTPLVSASLLSCSVSPRFVAQWQLHLHK